MLLSLLLRLMLLVLLVLVLAVLALADGWPVDEHEDADVGGGVWTVEGGIAPSEPSDWSTSDNI